MIVVVKSSLSEFISNDTLMFVIIYIAHIFLMSVSNLLHPNDYSLFSGEGSIPGETMIVVPGVAFVLTPTQTVTSSLIRGVANPSNLAPSITAVLSHSTAGSFVELCIPSFLITGVSGAGAITAIRLTASLPASICPQYAVSDVIPIQTVSGIVIGQLSISTAGEILLAPFSGNLGAANPFGGSLGDIYATYIPAV